MQKPPLLGGFFFLCVCVRAMTNVVDAADDLERLQSALEAVSADLDAIGQRPHFHLRHAADALVTTAPRGIGTFVDQFALAMGRAGSKRKAI